jgi:hypothetical protein
MQWPELMQVVGVFLQVNSGPNAHKLCAPTGTLNRTPQTINWPGWTHALCNHSGAKALPLHKQAHDTCASTSGPISAPHVLC